MAVRGGTLLVMVSAAWLCACGPAPVTGAQPSVDALGREVLAALAAGDRGRLNALALSETEFRVRIWPALPAARPERNLPFAYVWGDLRQKSDQRLGQTLAAHVGHRYVLTSVRFASPTTDFGAYRVHRDTVLVVERADGRRHDLSVLGSMVELDGRWKVFSYNVDD